MPSLSGYSQQLLDVTADGFQENIQDLVNLLCGKLSHVISGLLAIIFELVVVIPNRSKVSVQN